MYFKQNVYFALENHENPIGMDVYTLDFPGSSTGKESTCNAGDPSSIRWRRDKLPTPVFLSFPCGSAGKESACNEGDLGSIPGFGRSPGEGKGYPLQYSGLESSMDRTRLSNFHFHFLSLDVCLQQCL